MGPWLSCSSRSSSKKVTGQHGEDAVWTCSDSGFYLQSCMNPFSSRPPLKHYCFLSLVLLLALGRCCKQLGVGLRCELTGLLLLALVHEGTLVHAVSVLALWCNRFTTEVPRKLTEWFKKAFSLKTSTSAVRHAYLQCMLACFRGEMPPLHGRPSLPGILTVPSFPLRSTLLGITSF